MLRLLTLTSLFPNAVVPRHGIFVLERLKHLRDRHPVEIETVAPVPWFPSTHPRWSRYAAYASVPQREIIHGFDVRHPRFATLPRIGNATNPLAMAATILRTLRKENIAFDVIDAHYAFPDGVAAVIVARYLNKPLTLTVRGSDINVLPEKQSARWWLRRSLRCCDAVFAVSRALAERTLRLEPDLRERLRIVTNGVDQSRFSILDGREAIRTRWGLCGKTVLCVANLVPLKGVDLVIRALELLPDVQLIVAGTGTEEAALKRLVQGNGTASRVRFVGSLNRDDLIELYNAVDVSVLASLSEGMPNVVLESLACGTRVVSTDVGDIREVLASPDAGTVVPGRSTEALAEALARLLNNPVERERVRAQVKNFNWNRTSDGLMETFNSVLSAHQLKPHPNVEGKA